MAVTVKTVKKKKPLSLKKGGIASGKPGAEGAEDQPAEGAPAAAPVAAVGGKKQKAAAGGKRPSYTFAGVCAILEFLMFSAVLTLQILEWRFYEAPPKNAFPPFGIGPDQIPIPGGGGASRVPVAEEAGTANDMGNIDDGGVPVDDGAPVDDGVPVDEGVPVE